MAGENTKSTLDGLFKEIYSDSIQNLIPEQVKITKLIPFKQDTLIGNKYHQPVILTQEGGFTHETAGAGAFSLNSAIAAKMLDSQVDAFQVMLRSSMDYEAAARASSSKAAFMKATEVLVMNMQSSVWKRLEMLTLYGSTGLGTISTSSVSTNATVVMTDASWSPGVWIGSENMLFDAYNGSSKVNTNAALTVVSVDIENKTVVFSGNATDLINLAGTHKLFFYGSHGKEQTGLDAIATATSTYFNIDPGAYNLWKGNSYAVGGTNLTLGAALKGLALAVNKGLDEKCHLIVSSKTFAAMVTDQAALRKYDASYSKDESTNGSRFIKFFGQAGEVEVIPSNYVKEGEAFAMPKSLVRIGATEPTFNLPGMGGEGNPQFFLHLPTQAGFELRNYTMQNVFAPKPGHIVKFTGIVNS